MSRKSLASFALAGAALAIVTYKGRKRVPPSGNLAKEDEEEPEDPLGFLRVPSLSKLSRSPTVQKMVAVVAGYLLFLRVVPPSLQRARKNLEKYPIFWACGLLSAALGGQCGRLVNPG